MLLFGLLESHRKICINITPIVRRSTDVHFSMRCFSIIRVLVVISSYLIIFNNLLLGERDCESHWPARRINAYFVRTQVPGFRSFQTTTTTAFGSVKGFLQRIKNLTSVDETHFPKRSMRFTAVYSRDKEYLWVAYANNFIHLFSFIQKCDFNFELKQIWCPSSVFFHTGHPVANRKIHFRSQTVFAWEWWWLCIWYWSTHRR